MSSVGQGSLGEVGVVSTVEGDAGGVDDGWEKLSWWWWWCWRSSARLAVGAGGVNAGGSRSSSMEAGVCGGRRLGEAGGSKMVRFLSKRLVGAGAVAAAR